MNLTPTTDFRFIPETDDQSAPFCNLWPHRHDYIYSPPGIAAKWRTETRHPLSDRLLLQQSYLYGVRFGRETAYAMLDIDAHSPYHPNQDPMAIGRIMAALEPMGLVSAITVTSSYSGGLHLYFPWRSPLPTWAIAACLNALLSAAGMPPALGQLETFPNKRTHADQRYAAHRLPMQVGSYILDSDLSPVYGDRDEFCRRWELCRWRNDPHQGAIDQLLKRLLRNDYRLTKSAKKFCQDLDAEIEPGWTGRGQTNRILGRIALRGYCFGHIIDGDEPLTDRRLVRYICQTARSLPGFEEYCRHSQELERKAEFWARSVEASPRYFPYAIGKASPTIVTDGDREVEVGMGNAWNILQFQLARLKIREAIASLLNDGILCAGIRERLEQLMSFGFSSDTLYRHRDLWHPKSLTDPEPAPTIATSLLPSAGWINPLGRGYSLYLAKFAHQQGGSTFLERVLDDWPGGISGV
jgi:hypothetical protein